MVSRFFWILMFPDDHDLPACLSEPTLGVGVTFDIAPQFFSPPLRIRLRMGPVLRTRVPETAADVDGDPRANKGYIDSALQAGKRS